MLESDAQRLDRLFGPHDASFFETLGQIVATSALLEVAVLEFRQAVESLGQWEKTMVPVGQLINECRAKVQRQAESEDRTRIMQFLSSTSDWFERRNHYVHGVWPAQDDGSVFGWKPARNASPGAPVAAMRLSLGETQDDLSTVLGLVEKVPAMRVHLANSIGSSGVQR